MTRIAAEAARQRRPNALGEFQGLHQLVGQLTDGVGRDALVHRHRELVARAMLGGGLLELRELLLAGVQLGEQQVDVRLRLGLRQRRDGDGVLQHLLQVVAPEVLVSALPRRVPALQRRLDNLLVRPDDVCGLGRV